MSTLYSLDEALGGARKTVSIPPKLVWGIKLTENGEIVERDLSWIIENSANLRATARWYLEYLKDHNIDIDDSKKIFPLKVEGTNWKVKFWRSKSTGELTRLSFYEEDYE